MTASVIEETDILMSTDESDANDANLSRGEQKQRFVVMRAKGYSYARIAR